MRHSLFLVAATLLAGASAMAQTTHFALAYDSDNSTVVYTDDGRRFDLDGKVLNLGMDRQTVWTLTTGAKNYLYNNMAFNDFRVYKNDARVKTYKGDDDERYFSMAMRVNDGHVIIAGSKVSAFNSKGFEACLFGEVDFEEIFETEEVRKSLKRENFRGFSSLSAGKTTVPEYDEDGTYTLSLYYGVKDVDYYKGNIYASGWGEREYTMMYGTKHYFVRRCPRVWKNGKEEIRQAENQTGAAYSINVVNVGGKKRVLTSGHIRGKGSAWDGSNLIYTYPIGKFAVDKEAVIARGSIIYRCGLANRDHLFLVGQTNNKSGAEMKMLDSIDYGSFFFFDVVADPDNMDFYLLARSARSHDVEVWRLHCTGTSLGAPQKVYTFRLNESAESYKLAISRY